jgi:hypothetical protein
MLSLKRLESAPSSLLKRDFSKSSRPGAGRQYGRAYIKLSRTTPRPSPHLSRVARGSEVTHDA